MKKNFALGAAAAALGFTGQAQAVPLYFDFTGTVTVTSASSFEDLPTDWLGQNVTAGFTFETDRLGASSSSSPFPRVDYVDWEPVNPSEPLAFMSFGDRNVIWPAYPEGTNYATIGFNDPCNSSGCVPNVDENFNLQAISNDDWSADFTGTLRSTSLLFFSSGRTVVDEFPFWIPFDYFDSATVDPTSIVSLPLYDLVGIYSESVSTCVAGTCSGTMQRQANFSIESVSRGVGPRSVPEPGTLGLLGVALAGMLVLRRRQPLLQR